MASPIRRLQPEDEPTLWIIDALLATEGRLRRDDLRAAAESRGQRRNTLSRRAHLTIKGHATGTRGDRAGDAIRIALRRVEKARVACRDGDEVIARDLVRLARYREWWMAKRQHDQDEG